jgi:hypothetical protein
MPDEESHVLKYLKRRRTMGTLGCQLLEAGLRRAGCGRFDNQGASAHNLEIRRLQIKEPEEWLGLPSMPLRNYIGIHEHDEMAGRTYTNVENVTIRIGRRIKTWRMLLMG